MTNASNYVTKTEIEEWSGVLLTSEQWNSIKGEIEGRLDNYLDGLLQEIVLDIKEGHYDPKCESCKNHLTVFDGIRCDSCKEAGQ